MHFHYRVTFTGYIRCFCATTSHDHFDLDLWPFWPWKCFMYSASHVWPTYRFLLSYDYRLLSYEYWISDHISIIWKSLRMRRVTWPLTGGKNSPHFWNPWPQFAYSLCHFDGATTKIKPCYRQKIAFSPLWRLQSLLRMRSITWPVHRRSPKTTRNNFWPRIAYSLLQLLWGYDDD